MEDLFDAVDVESRLISQGHADGLREGRISGRHEGRQVGIKTGFEIGEELGYYDGWAEAVEGMFARQALGEMGNGLPERAAKSASLLREMIARFPLGDAAAVTAQEQLEAIRARFKALSTSVGVRPTAHALSGMQADTEDF
eukprot:jgi/Mesvir1/15898/Mv02801-RA.1